MTKYSPLPAGFFRANREKLHRSLAPSSLVICFSNDVMPVNADAHYPFVQQSDLYYLTGIDQEDTVFLYYKNAEGNAVERLFIRESNEWITTWEGQKLSPNEAANLSGIALKNILVGEGWKDYLQAFLPNIQHVYINAKEISVTVSPKTRAEEFGKEISRLIHAPVLPLSDLTKPLRTCKSNVEVDTIRKAIEITHQAFVFACKQVKTSTFEYEIEAALTYKMLQLGAERHAFQPIIAAGASANVLHYVTNHQKLNQGELILMDFGASYANYKADITRCIPVSGRFSERQKEVYTAVLTLLKQCIAELKVGNSVQEWKLFAEEMVAEQLLILGLLQNEERMDELKKKATVKKYFPHSIGHHLGLDVHDVCDYSLKFEEGMVLTCEPGIYIREESIGIRLETDVFITSRGPIDLGVNIPIEINDIEKLME